MTDRPGLTRRRRRAGHAYGFGRPGAGRVIGTRVAVGRVVARDILFAGRIPIAGDSRIVRGRGVRWRRRGRAARLRVGRPGRAKR